jgi:hypothetical protein
LPASRVTARCRKIQDGNVSITAHNMKNHGFLIVNAPNKEDAVQEALFNS